jgi:hypothetical protein
MDSEACKCPTKGLDLGAITEDGALEKDRSDATEGYKAQPLKGGGYENTALRLLRASLCSR